MIKNKLNLPKVIKATYKIITPMFIGDAEQKASCISPMSFKGALRFWWRALVWNRIRSEYRNDEDALKALHDEESMLFGDTDNGVGLVKLKLLSDTSLKKETNWPLPGVNNASYLAYGLTGDNSNPHREAIADGPKFDVELIYSNLDLTQVNELNKTLELIGLCGGLGARARRGNGSIQLIKLNGKDYNISSIADYKAHLSSLLKPIKVPKGAYSALSEASDFRISSYSTRSARDAYSQLGKIYKEYRSQYTKSDLKEKIVLGLPLTNIDSKTRRSSPLFFHIVEVGNNQFTYAVLYMPTTIFSDNYKYQNVNWPLAAKFLDKIGDK